ncbi:MAG: hypothetical protein Q7T01_00240 [bacterium]|nr:hypothetical protein [bacterium]
MDEAQGREMTLRDRVAMSILERCFMCDGEACTVAMGNIVGRPRDLQMVSALLWEMLQRRERDCIAGVTPVGTCLATALALDMNTPQVFPFIGRYSTSGKCIVHGSGRPGQRVVLISHDVVNGASMIEAVLYLREAGFIVQDALTLVSFEAGDGGEALSDIDISLTECFRFQELLDYYIAHHRITRQHADAAFKMVQAEAIRRVNEQATCSVSVLRC